MATNGPSENENQLQEFGADVFEELFGDPENPGTLLWIVNGIYHTTKKAMDCLCPCSAKKQPKIKPD